MKLLIKARKIKLDANTKEYMKHRVSFAFARSRHLIRTLTITIADINGPKGGNDKQCKVLIRTNDLTDIVITEKQSNLFASIDRALTRSSQNLLQRVKRKRSALRARLTHQSIMPLDNINDDYFDEVGAAT